MGGHYRFFIELQHAPAASRDASLEIRRRAALDFVTQLRAWLQDHGRMEDVTRLQITPLGQIQITCTPDVIEDIRTQDVLAIAQILRGENMTNNLRKIAETIGVTMNGAA